jgi:hypothetical protein
MNTDQAERRDRSAISRELLRIAELFGARDTFRPKKEET